MGTSSFQRRRLFSAGDWLTLVGMGVVVVSAALTWSVELPEVTEQSEVAAIYVSRMKHEVAGFDVHLGRLRAGWVVVVCAVAAGALLLWEPSPREAGLIRAAHAGLAVAILAVAGLHAGPYPGVVLALLGGVLMLAGAFARSRPPNP